MDFNFKMKSLKRADLTGSELRFAQAAFESDPSIRFGIDDEDKIVAVYFSSPPTESIAKQLGELRHLYWLGVAPVLIDYDPMVNYKEGCLDILIESTLHMKLKLFLAARIPLSSENLDTLSRIKSIEYLRCSSNIYDRHVDFLKKFRAIKSMTLAECPRVSCASLINLLTSASIPELYPTEGLYSSDDRIRLKKSSPATKFRFIP